MQNELEPEIERRLAEIRNDPERLMRYDINGDGIISDDEWEEVRRFVTTEVTTEHARSREKAQQTDLNEKKPQTKNEPILETLQNRFELMRVIGQGAQGKTFFGRDRQSGDAVAIKELQMSQVEAWQAIDLFEREADVLKNVSHPAIPAFIDFFHTEDPDEHGMRSFLVQEFVDGEDLKELMESGVPVDEPTARAFLKEILDVLNYLHTLPDPIIHGDIKLSNIIRRRDQRLALIDFGAVQSITKDDEISHTVRPTIVGTSGYMPLEQMMGRSVPATDLYALAATTVHLLSRRHPADLPVIGMALQFEDFVNISKPLEQTLKKMLAPHVEHRFQSANDVLRALEQAPLPPTQKTPQKALPQPNQPSKLHFGQPDHADQTLFNPWNTNSTVLATRTPQPWLTEINNIDGQISLKIPQQQNPMDIITMALTAPFLAFGILGTIMYLTQIFKMNVLELLGGIAFMLCFTGIALAFAWPLYNKAFSRITIDIDQTTLHHHRKNYFGTKTISIPLRAISAVVLVPPLNDATQSLNMGRAIELQSHNDIVSIGQHLPLVEKQHLIALILDQQTASRHKN